MSPRRTRTLTLAQASTHLAAMAVISVVMGVLIAGLALPFTGALGLGAQQATAAIKNIPAKLVAEPLSQRTRVLAANGKTLAIWYDQNRVNVTLDHVAPIMRKAILSIEDYRFYQHGAIDLKGTLRALLTNEASGGVVQGGSSITQQMVKMTLLNQAETEAQRLAATADTYQRKINELRYAIAFEQNYSKDWILERYLNIAYFGDGAYGIEAAARHYFSKSASKLNIAQSALLAGLVKNPTAYDPNTYPKNAKIRRNTVLARMAQLSVITPQKAAALEKTPLGLKVSPNRNGCVSTIAPFFCDYVRRYLLADPAFGKTVQDRQTMLNTGGLTIKTTLDPRFQRAADKAERKHVYPTDHAIGGLSMVEPGTGDVKALAQSRPMGSNAKKGQTYLNYVVPPQYGDSGGFQAGSTFKVFVLSSAINQGIPLHTRISAPPRVYIPISKYRDCSGPLKSTQVWSPANSTGSGTFDLYSGTQESVNTFFAQLEERTGLCEPVRLARAMGVTVPQDQVVPSFTLGIVNTDPTTMAGVYATFAARGIFCTPHPVTEVLSSDGSVLKSYDGNCHRVMPATTADAVNDILRGVQEPGGFGYSNGLELNQESAGKTGTIENNKAVWFIGYTPNLAAASMLAGADRKGNWLTLNGQTIGGRYVPVAFGSTNAGPIWGDAMHAIEQWLPNVKFVPPTQQTIDGNTFPVPDVSGMSPADAAKILSKAGLNPIIGGQVDSNQPQGAVAYTSPGAGTNVTKGTTIVIYTSTGNPPPPSPSPSPTKTKGNGNGHGPPKPGTSPTSTSSP